MTKFYMIAVDNDKNTIDGKWMDDDVILSNEEYANLLATEERYKEHLHSLITHTLIDDAELQNLRAAEEKYNNIKNEYFKLKVRYTQENLLKFVGGTPVDWAFFNITKNLHDYLKEHNVKDSDSITEKRMQTVAFVHCLEDKLLDYIDKLEDFNS